MQNCVIANVPTKVATTLGMVALYIADLIALFILPQVIIFMAIANMPSQVVLAQIVLGLLLMCLLWLRWRSCACSLYFNHHPP